MGWVRQERIFHLGFQSRRGGGRLRFCAFLLGVSSGMGSCLLYDLGQWRASPCRFPST